MAFDESEAAVALEEALELQIVARTLKDVHLAQRGSFDKTADSLARIERHFERLGEHLRAGASS